MSIPYGDNLLSFHYFIDIYPLTGNTKFVMQGLLSYSVLFLAFAYNLRNYCKITVVR